MSLFIGNISKRATPEQLQKAFRSFGKCKVDLRVRGQPRLQKKFAFVQYENEKDAEAAKNQLNNTDFCGRVLNIEWAKNSGRFQENTGRGRRDGGRRRSASRQRSWDRNKRYRSISRQRRRQSPDYSQDLDVAPHCARDMTLLQQLILKKEGQRKTQKPEVPGNMEVEDDQKIATHNMEQEIV